jgi:hypothetical protein
MAQEMTSFVLRFVRDASEEQGARWRGLVQHVQSGTERNFATFAEAVQFMQGQVVEHTVQALEKGPRMPERNGFTDLAGEMARMWGDLGPQMVERWGQAAAQMVEQSAALRSHIDRAVASALQGWGNPAEAEEKMVEDRVAQLAKRVETLTARVDALESELKGKS